MNYFQKNILQALQDLKQKYILGNNSSFPQGDYFRQPSFVELDNMLIYMFKVYQQTQSVTYGAYIVTIEAIALSYLKITIGLTAFLGLGLLLWLKSIPGQKKALSRLYGHLLLVPFLILKANTRIASSLKEAIEYSDWYYDITLLFTFYMGKTSRKSGLDYGWMNGWIYDGWEQYMCDIRMIYYRVVASGGNFLDIGILDPCDITVHFLIHALQFIGILFQFHELIFEWVQIVHRIGQRIHHVSAGVTHLCDFVLELFHLVHLAYHLLTLFLTLLLEFLPALDLTLTLHLLLLFLLNLHDAIVHLD